MTLSGSDIQVAIFNAIFEALKWNPYFQGVLFPKKARSGGAFVMSLHYQRTLTRSFLWCSGRFKHGFAALHSGFAP